MSIRFQAYRKNVEIPPSSSRARYTAVVRSAALLYCRCGLVDTYWVGRWVGGGCVGGWRLAPSPRWRRISKKTKLPLFLAGSVLRLL